MPSSIAFWLRRRRRRSSQHLLAGRGCGVWARCTQRQVLRHGLSPWLVSGPSDRSHRYHARERPDPTIQRFEWLQPMPVRGSSMFLLRVRTRRSAGCQLSSREATGHARRLTTLSLAGWRRQVAEIYGEVRRARGSSARSSAMARAPRPAVPPSTRRAHSDGGRSDAHYRPSLLALRPRLRFAVPRSAVSSERSPTSIATGEEELTRRIRQVGMGGAPRPGRRPARRLVARAVRRRHLRTVPRRYGGNSSYGAGRYLFDTAKGADLGLDGDARARLQLRLPPLVSLRPRWQCPLAPPENILSAAIEAGEKLSPKGSRSRWVPGLEVTTLQSRTARPAGLPPTNGDAPAVASTHISAATP